MKETNLYKPTEGTLFLSPIVMLTWFNAGGRFFLKRKK